MSKEKEWKVGDKYKIIDDGQVLTGTIIEITHDGRFIVKWSDNVKTIEDWPSPTQETK